METALEHLRQYLQQPGTPPPPRAELEALCAQYPWFAEPYAALCRAYADDMSDTEVLGLRQRVALITGDASAAVCDVPADSTPAAPAQPPQPLAPPQFMAPLPEVPVSQLEEAESQPVQSEAEAAVPPPFTGLPTTPPPFTGFAIDEDSEEAQGFKAEGIEEAQGFKAEGFEGAGGCEAEGIAAEESDAAEAGPSATDQVLSTYFSTFAHTTAEEDALLERMIFNPQPDYASVLMQQEAEQNPEQQPDEQPREAEKLPGAAEVAEAAAAVQAIKPQQQRSAERPKPASDSSLLSESLAKIFIKQGRYDRAYEIISNLNLNYPEKSVYFADQLRFLRKLMLLKAAADRTNETHGE